MRENLPKVSIVLPTYNGSTYIRESIESCLNQSYKNIELVILDDCSKDNTPQIVASYSDQRIKYQRQEKNGGLPRALNAGFAHATGQFLTWTSDDNYYAPLAIERMYQHLNSHKRIDFVYTNYFKIDNEGKIIGKKSMGSPEKLSHANYVGACFLYRRKVYEQVGDYNPEVALVEDYEYWLRVRQKFLMKWINEYFYYYRVHPDSLTSTCNLKKAEALAEKVRDRYVTDSTRYYLAAKKYFENENYTEAKSYLNKCFMSNITNSDVWRMFAILHLNPKLVNKIRLLKGKIPGLLNH